MGDLERHRLMRLSTYGIVFMGTPHQSTNITLGNLFLRLVSLSVKTNSNLVQDDLKREFEWLEDQMRSYLPISDDFRMICCYETKPTPPLHEVVSFHLSRLLA